VYAAADAAGCATAGAVNCALQVMKMDVEGAALSTFVMSQCRVLHSAALPAVTVT